MSYTGGFSTATIAASARPKHRTKREKERDALYENKDMNLI